MVAVTIYLAALVVVLVATYFKFIYRKRRDDEPPIPKGHWLWGNGEDFSKHAVKFLHQSQKKLGDIFTIRLFNQCMTIIMDPHSYEQMVKEKNFDFDVIQRQVNHNVFSFALVDARKMLKEAGKTVKGQHLVTGMARYSDHLNNSFMKVSSPEKVLSEGDWHTDGLRSFNSQTLFTAMFYTIFGRGSQTDAFEPSEIYRNLDQFHKYFNYLWLGFPIKLFPKAQEALSVLCQLPDSKTFLARDDLSEYIRFATNFMLERGQTESDIIGHNLVYLHVNYNTFRMAFWCVYHLLENKKALDALRQEVNELIEEKAKEMGDDEKDEPVAINLEELDSLKILESIIKETLRTTSGVFMVRSVLEDTMFTTNNGQEFRIRKGDKVAMYPPAIHKDAEIFENPDEFIYDRFIGKKFYKNGKELKHPIMSFGSICPGKKYAYSQAKWFLLTLVHMFDMELLPGESTTTDAKYHGHEILPPTNEVQIRYRLRQNHRKLEFCD